MNLDEAAFRLANLFVLPFWGLLVFAPGWSGTAKVIRGTWYLGVLAAYYVVVAAAGLGTAEVDWKTFADPTLPGVRKLLANPAVAGPAWTHFLVFDLFVARWIFLQESKPGWRLSPIFFCTLMFGPAGLLAYLLLQGWTGASASKDAPAASPPTSPTA